MRLCLYLHRELASGYLFSADVNVGRPRKCFIKKTLSVLMQVSAIKCSVTTKKYHCFFPHRFIPVSGSLILSAKTLACAHTESQVSKLEHVQLVLSLKHRHRGDLSITLISPSGTRSQLLTTRRNDHSSRGLKVT